MQYKVKIIRHEEQIVHCPSFQVDFFQWTQGYTPKTYGKLAYLEDKGFLLEMCCEETDPRRVYTDNDTMVCEDSCMEAFINFAPQKNPLAYVNFEINANGALLCQYGRKNPDRGFVSEMDIPLPDAQAQIKNGEWTARLFISEEFVVRLFGEVHFKEGCTLTGNFFKCGDLTAHPHFGSWQPVQAPVPNFHLPEFFGQLVLSS